jgi:hypothetical protein
MNAPLPPKPPMRGAIAGSLLLGTIVLCAVIGFGLGALVGMPVPLGMLGFFAGLVAGFVVVHSRFRDL